MRRTGHWGVVGNPIRAIRAGTAGTDHKAAIATNIESDANLAAGIADASGGGFACGLPIS